MKKISDYDIQAFVDNELNPAQKESVWDGICANADLRQRYQDLVTQKKILMQWWQTKNH